MTVAICLKCGAMKHGAWTPCPRCKHTPEDPEDKAKHVMTSDHYFSKTDIQSISTRVQSGQPLHFDQKQVEELTATMATVNPEKSVRLFVYGFFTIIIAVIVGAIYLIGRFVLK
jgi:hypothetical protein